MSDEIQTRNFVGRRNAKSTLTFKTRSISKYAARLKIPSSAAFYRCSRPIVLSARSDLNVAFSSRAWNRLISMVLHIACFLVGNLVKDQDAVFVQTGFFIQFCRVV